MNKDLIKTKRTSRIVLLLSLIVFTFWYIGNSIDIYQFALVGAIFELLWLPMLALIFVLPIISVYYLIKEKFTIKSLYIYSILIIGITILGMVFMNQ